MIENKNHKSITKSNYKKRKKKYKITKQTKNIIKFTGIIGAIFVLNSTDYLRNHANKETMDNTIQNVDYREFVKTYIPKNPEIIEIDDLLNEYKKAYTIKEVKEIDDYYKGKYVEITGEINNVYLGSVDGNFITLKGEEESFNNLMTIECRFEDKEEIKEAKEYEKGDDITIQGYFIGSDVSTIIIKESVVK